MSIPFDVATVRIRLAHPGDLSGILQVVAATHPERQFRSLSEIGHHERQRAFMSGEFVQPFVAVVDNQVVGCAVVQRLVRPWCAAEAELTGCHTLPGTDHSVLHQLEEYCRRFAKAAWGAVLSTH